MNEESKHPAQRERIIHEDLLKFLKEHPKGLTMTELVNGAGFSRKAIEKHLQVLALENELYVKQFGVTKVYYPNHRVHHLDFEQLRFDNKIIWFNLLEGEQGLYLLIRKKKQVGNEWVHEDSITLPITEGERFVASLKKMLKSPRTKAIMKQQIRKEG
ncbi:MAG: hypothetical protein Q7R87_01280 [Nanoarchaeota archaeon]|nr:hypothetical protein [Nanoarchaeota archaeon]